jgi:catechol 2,3-dioxygenase-like lactoylglutathione lyase family enzyme
MSLRIRQIVFAAADLKQAIEQFQDALGLQVTYRDPGVAKFGLENALFTFGDQFIEIVSPTRADTAASRHLDRHGDSAYMLILQTDDLSRDRLRLQDLGVRIVWESHLEEISALHLHPKDVGAAIVSLDQATPPSSWRWAGRDWERHRSPSSRLRIVDATISALDPEAMARRWSKVLGLDVPAGDASRLPLTDGELLFDIAVDARERISGYSIAAPRPGELITLCGTRFTVNDSRASE